MKFIVVTLFVAFLSSCAGLTIGGSQPLDLTKLEKQLGAIEAGANSVATIYAGTDKEEDIRKLSASLAAVRGAIKAAQAGGEGDLSMVEAIEFALTTIDGIIAGSDDQDLRVALAGMRTLVELLKIQLDDQPPQPPLEPPVPGAESSPPEMIPVQT
jgi:hypothetical protein